MRRIALIMAGGSGERFWPLSRRNRPKQFLRLTGGNKSLLKKTVLNILPLFSKEHIFLATGKHLVATTINEKTGVPVENILAEPFKRNTFGCIVLASAVLLSRYKSGGDDITMGVFPADHNIANTEKFRKIVDAALSVAEEEKALVTLGIKPVRPETGYGYIEITGGKGSTINSIPVYNVACFHEKPDHKTAKEYISTEKFYWNSGMFFWRLSTFLDELRDVSPDLLKSVEIMTEALSSGNQKLLMTAFESLADISIDYALMEKATRVLVLKADFEWDDVGAWDALDRTITADISRNVTVGNPILIDTENCIVYNDSGSEKTTVGVIGVDGLAVIVSDNGVLVVPKNRAQDVRKIVTELKKRNSRK
ncbi:mannose-1-phosphate guanylyltransferase [Candidatus Latescibacterota bacterium]